MINITNNCNGRIAMFSLHSDPLASLGSHESGGQNVYIHNLVLALDKRGWAIDVFTRLDDSLKKTVVKIGRHSRVVRLKGGETTYIPKSHLHSFFREIYENFLKFINFQNPYDLFHGHHYDGGWIALLAHKEFHKPFIQNFHSLGRVRLKTEAQYVVNILSQKEIFKQRFAMEDEIIKEATLIISLAEIEKRDAHLLYGAPLKKIIIIPGGVDIECFSAKSKNSARSNLSISKKDFILLFVGRLEWRKGAGTLISAAGLLKEIIPNLKVLVVGGKIFGPERNEDDWKEYQRLLQKAKQEGVHDLVNFIGRVDHERLPFFYSAADILVVPSYYEPFGLVVLEGMASQIPVVASRKGGLRIIIKDCLNGLLFEPRNAGDLKEKILEIYHSEKLARFLVENAYQDILEKYSWQCIAKKIEDLYKPLINL